MKQAFRLFVLTALLLGQFTPAGVQPARAQTSFTCADVSEIPQLECQALVALYNSTNGAGWTNNTNWLATNTPGDWYGVGVFSGQVTSISLSSNNLVNSLPIELGDLTYLQLLYLYNNQLSGSIPAELGNLSSLNQLSLNSNQLTGAIPAELGNLASLQTLDLSNNQLSGVIPAELGNLTNLAILYLSNNQLSGIIPAELGSLSNLSHLALDNNQLSGIIPTELGNLTNLAILYLFNNQLSESIPAELGSLSNLNYLFLQNNQLSGDVPPSFINLVNLYDDNGLDLSYNYLTVPATPQELAIFLTLKDPDWATTQRNPFTSCANVTVIPLVECQALEVLYNATGGANWANHQNWFEPGSEISTWYGVTIFGGHVTGLSLGFNQLVGTLPAEIGSLTNLAELWLGDNQLSGAIPAEFGSLTNLNMLRLNNNQLSGDIPPSFTNLVNLYDGNGLDLSYNQLNVSGVSQALAEFLTLKDPDWASTQLNPFTSCANVTAIPVAECQALEALYNATGGANWANHQNWFEPGSEISTWYGVTISGGHVTGLSLWGNQLTGSIPAELGSLTNLNNLSLSGNQLSGTIPAELSSLSSLNRLSLSDNLLSGAIPAELGSLTNLNYLYLSNNQLSGAIPAELGSLTNLSGLFLLSNQFSGSIPAELSGLTNLNTLSLNGNQLSGTIPAELGSLTNLNYLYLSGNQLSGVIPAELGSLSNLLGLTLEYNQLNGSIPAELGSLSNLNQLSLSGNQLSGVIPVELGSLTNLNYLDLSGNPLSGAIPSELGNLTNLINLSLVNNQLSGSIPAELGNLTNLTELLLYGNQLNGAIPSELGNLTNLNTLYLDDNQLSGSIPSELGSLTNLFALRLSSNQLSGTIPIELGSLTNLTRLYLDRNQLSGSIPSELGSLANLNNLTLSDNQLSGSIPAEFGSLTNLNSLHLNNNQLSGDIPTSFTNLVNLYDGNGLDLSYNQLNVSGVPQALAEFLTLKDPDWATTQRNPFTSCANVTAIPVAECQALEALYNATGGVNWANHQNWFEPGSEISTWYGVTISSGHVTGLSLGLNQLIGTIPAEIGSLTNLTELWLSDNQLSGAIPAEFGSLTNLNYLFLQNNQFSGDVPPSFTNLVNLYDGYGMDLSYNQLNVSGVPQALAEFLTLKDPDWASTQRNPFTSCANVTSIPVAECQALEALYNTTGGINWANHQNWFELGSEISTWYGVTISGGHVTQLSLGFNQLVGTLPAELGSLANLNGLYLHGNQLSGTIPAELGNLTSLQGISIFYNQLTGSIPVEMGNLTSLQYIDLSSNGLTGSIPVEMGNLTSLQDLRLFNNQLTGIIPPELGNLSSLQYVDLSGNKLTGNIPVELGNLTSLWHLTLEGNQLTGSIPVALGNLTNLGDLRLSDNHLTGSIPAEFGNLTSLDILYLHNNQLTGSIPVELGDLTNLNYLYLGGNQLSGTIPVELSGLTHLNYLYLNNNHLSGDVPPSFINLVNLYDGYGLDLSYNYLTVPATPQELANFLALKDPDWADTQTGPRGSISGYVFKPDGATVITDALISVHAHGITPGASSLGTYVSQSDGSYTISGLAPGTYKVQVNNNHEPGYVSKYYDNKFNWDQADTVIVVGGETTPNINFTLETGGTIRGTVLKEGGGVITDVQLHVGAGTETGIWRSTTISQVDGSYEISGLPDGQYRVEANFHTLGYDRKYYDNVYRWDQATLITISGGNVVENIDFALGPGGGISGYVYAQDGVTPLENVCVNVSSTAPDFNQVVGWGRTGPDGSFSFGGVPVGNVYIRTHATCGGSNAAYIDEWYAAGGSVIDGNDADLVLIQAGQMTNGLTFTLNTGGTISGYVYKADGTTVITDTLISVHAHGTSFGAGTNVSQVDGSYTITGLPPGEYRIQANNNMAAGYVTKYYNNKYNWDDADPVVISSGETITNINFTLETGGSISGFVLQSDGTTPIQNAWVYAMGTNFQYIGGSHSGADGSYHINGLAAGNYYLAVQADGFGGVYYPNGHDDPGAQQVTVTPPADTGNINFNLSPEATISGFVYQSDGVTPIPGAQIEAGPRSGGQNRRATSGADGSYTIHGLSSGTYVAKVDASGYETEYYLNAYDWNSATPIAVTQPQNTPGINFTLYNGGLLPAEKTVLETLYNNTGGTGWTNKTGWMVNENACTWYGVTCHDGYVISLNLNGNQLAGSLPPELGNLSNVQVLFLGNNQLSGSIPSELGNLTSLQRLYLFSNQLNGSIPSELVNLTGLQRLYLSSNQLTGNIPAELGDLTSLTWLNLNNNQLTGNIPSALGNLSNLQHLLLYSNQFTGSIPPELGNLSNLLDLELNNNQLTGSIPSELGNLSNLQYILIHSNQFTGSIPPELGNLSNLQRLMLYSNQLSGSIPAQLGNLNNLQYLNLGNNQLSGSIPAVLGNLNSLQRLSLYNNQLTGSIPPELGNLTSLVMLWLNNNHLSGEVPASFVNLVNLCDSGAFYGGDSLDLDYNTLVIPAGYPVTGNPLHGFLSAKDPDWHLRQTIESEIGSEGGEMTSLDQATQVTVPAGALTGDTTFTYTPQPSPGHDFGNLSFTQNSFQLSAVDGSGNPVTTFTQPLNVTIAYDETSLGVPEESLQLYYWDTGANVWRDAVTTCPGGVYTRDLAANTFSLGICHLSEFAVFGGAPRIFLPIVLH